MCYTTPFSYQKGKSAVVLTSFTSIGKLLFGGGRSSYASCKHNVLTLGFPLAYPLRFTGKTWGGRVSVKFQARFTTPPPPTKSYYSMFILFYMFVYTIT